jgi:hypothetical protein
MEDKVPSSRNSPLFVKGDSMECKECRKWIPSFISKEMDYIHLKTFLNHIGTCPDCKEELTIQILVTEGLNRLEEGDAFDLANELNKRLEDARHRLKFHKTFLSVGIILEILAMLAIVGVVIWILL